MTVISLAAARAERQPHWQGKAICLGCRHEWEAIAPMGTYTDLECAECGLFKGVTKHPFGCDEGDLEFRCTCGCEALTVYKRAKDGRFYTRCMACGTDHTAAIYGDAS